MARAEERADGERRAVEELEAATAQSAPERQQLSAAVADLDEALARARVQRVVAAATDPGHDLWASLGPPPSTRAGLAVWCGMAERLEAKRDGAGGSDRTASIPHRARSLSCLGPPPGRGLSEPAWPGLVPPPDNDGQIVAAASLCEHLVEPGDPLADPSLWRPALAAAQRRLALERPAVQAEPDLGHSLGL